MRNALIVSFLLISLSGCTSLTQRDEALTHISGVEFATDKGYEYIQAYRTSAQLTAQSADLEACVLQNVSNRDVVLTDSSSGFVDVYTGRYFDVSNSVTASGGSVIKKAEKHRVIADGTTMYSANKSANDNRVVRFTLTIDIDKTTIHYYFSNIQQALINSGGSPNKGFFDIRVNEGAKPSAVIAMLNHSADKMTQCMNQP